MKKIGILSDTHGMLDERVFEHFELCEKYHLHGIHLNKRNSGIPKDYKGHISRSCHNFQEVTAALNIPNKENPEGNAPASK